MFSASHKQVARRPAGASAPTLSAENAPAEAESEHLYRDIFENALTGMFQTTVEGDVTQLTKTAEGTLHYHPTPSPDGKWLLYGSKRDGVRQLFVMRLADRGEYRLTHLKPGHGAMWPHWQPASENE